MLDEPTVFLDESRRQDLIGVIKRLTSMPQMIIVTHDPRFAKLKDINRIFWLKDGKIEKEGKAK